MAAGKSKKVEPMTFMRNLFAGCAGSNVHSVCRVWLA